MSHTRDTHGDTCYLDRQRFFSTDCNHEIVVHCKRCCKLSTLSIGNVYAWIFYARDETFFIPFTRRHRKGRKAPYSATKDCFLNGESFLSCESRERGYTEREKGRECKERTKERERMREREWSLAKILHFRAVIYDWQECGYNIIW